MVGFKNRYMVLEILIDPNKILGKNDHVEPTDFNVSKAIKDSIRVNFGECGLASSLGSFKVRYLNPITNVCIIRASREDYQSVWCAITLVTTIGNCPVLLNLLDLSGSIKACRKAALSCEEAKFEHYKLVNGGKIKDEKNQQMRSFLDRLKTLEH